MHKVHKGLGFRLWTSCKYTTFASSITAVQRFCRDPTPLAQHTSAAVPTVVCVLVRQVVEGLLLVRQFVEGLLLVRRVVEGLLPPRPRHNPLPIKYPHQFQTKPYTLTRSP